MNRFVVALCAFVSTGVVAAQAADMPVKGRSYYAPEPVLTWSGFYAGLNGGYGWATGSLKGAVAGGQLGYNWQTGAFVFGVEGDFNASWQKKTDTLGPITVEQKLPWYATARGRLGWASNSWMLYGTAGVGWINYKVTGTLGGAEISDNATKAALAVGGGFEWMFMPRWSAKLEYLYMDTGNTDITLFGTVLNGRVKDNIVRAGINYHF
jgi:outer membrane immunogenic protein